MADRAYFVKLNLDDMAASLDALDSTEERGQWLEGFRVGSRGNKSRDGWAEAKVLGYRFGLDCWEKAEEFREKQAVKGRASGESRKRRTEDEPESNHGSTAVEPQMNQPPNREGSSQKPEAINQEATEQDPPTPQGGPASVVDLWNELVAGTNLPRARLTPSRSRTIGIRLKEKGWMDDFRAALGNIVGSDFHRGANDRKWIADLDYLLQPGKSTQLAEKARASPLPAKPNGKTQWTGINERDYTAGTEELRKGPDGSVYL